MVLGGYKYVYPFTYATLVYNSNVHSKHADLIFQYERYFIRLVQRITRAANPSALIHLIIPGPTAHSATPRVYAASAAVTSAIQSARV